MLDFPKEDIIELAKVFNKIDFDSFDEELKRVIKEKEKEKEN